ncbi:hypothetical protein [Maritimibacter sp. DP1N21-5]|uniref:hypothetical protein n=1 Tax=Maritimibacter sp. DP1N21-5 TaxID=2836867 RepID=UPI001C4470CA|nr:hypothetical protein [Maritimibacter sp. DP1N21-5]MBV7409728.1 hypothetical protein [Maritimibacter sp. DP1N21-5]
MWRGLLWVLASVGLFGCAAQAPLTTAQGPDILAPYETGPWPEFMAGADLDPGRDYVVLAYVPPANPIDLSSPDAARRTLALMVFDQLGAMEAGTTIGHLIVGWQCGGRRGMTSMTGEQARQGQKMFLSGWGVTPVFSTFLDGALVGLADIPPAQTRALVEGRGLILAAETTRADCEAARSEVARFARHPDRPHRRYSLLEDPTLYEGGGCLSFALHIARTAGVLSRLPDLVRRDLDLRAVQLGTHPVDPEHVEVYRSPKGHPERPVFWLDLLMADWEEGPVLDTVTIPDGEAILAAMALAHEGLIAKSDWRYSRMMSLEDPVVLAAARYGAGWARGFGSRRLSDADGAGVLVLER